MNLFKKKKSFLYLSGPITNLPSHRRVFSAVKNDLVNNGFNVLTPVEIWDAFLLNNPGYENTHTPEEIWEQAMELDKAAISNCCYGIATIEYPRPIESKGMLEEKKLAEQLQLPIGTAEDWCLGRISTNNKEKRNARNR